MAAIPISDSLNIILGLNSMTIQIFLAVMTIVLAVIFSAGGGGKGYLRGLILLPFLNLLCVIALSLWGMDFTIAGILFFMGLVFMAIGIYISRNDERVLA